MDGWPEQSSPGTIDSEEATEEKWKWKWKWKWKRERPRPSRGREAGGGRRETRGSNLERLKRLKEEGDEMRRRRPMGVEGDARGGCSGSKRTDPFFFNRKERGANPSGRRPSGDEDWVVPSAMGILEAPLHWGEQMPAPGGTAVHTSSAKKGARPLASRSRGSETLCIFIASSNCIVNYHEKGFRVLFCRANLTTHFSMPFSTPIFHPSSRPSRPLPHPCHNHHRRWPLDLVALQTFRNPRG